MSERLKQLRAAWKSKSDEANAIIARDNATGEQLTNAEKLFDECDTILKDIENIRADQTRREALGKRAEQARKSWSEPEPALIPFSTSEPAGGNKGQSRFRLDGWEEAGHTTIDPYLRHVVEEVGPGTFGEKTWELLQSFEYRKDFARYVRKGARVIDASVKTLQEGLDDQGGVFAPAELLMRVVGRQPAPTSIRGRCQQFTTGRDALVMLRKQYSADDKYTTAFRATWTGEIPASSTAHAVNDANLLGTVTVPVHQAMLSAPITEVMAEDSAFNLMTWLEAELNQVVDLLYEDMPLNGTSNSQPTGVYYNKGGADSPEVVLSGTADALSYDGFVNCCTALAPQYDNNAVWVMNKKSAFRAVCKLKDSANRPIFNRGEQDSGLASARTMSIEGYPIVFSQFTEDVGDGLYPVVFGDWRGYYLVNRLGFSIKVLDQIQALQGAIVLRGRLRFGGKPVEHWRLKLLKSDNA